MCFEELLDIYFRHKRLRSATEWSYKKIVRSLLVFKPDIKPAEVTKEIVLQWRESLLDSDNPQAIKTVTWNNKVAHMRAIFNFCFREDLLPVTGNPFANMVVKAGKKAKKTLTTKQMNQLFNYLENCIEEENSLDSEDARKLHGGIYPCSYFLPLCATLRYTAVRKNQLLNIRIKDVDLHAKVIFLQSHASKNHNEHCVPIIDKLHPYLETVLRKAIKLGAQKDDLLFDLNRFDPLRASQTNGFDAFFRRISTLLGYRISPHRFRHSLATQLMKSPDRNLPIVKNLLGHQSIASTLEYIQTDVDELRNVLQSNVDI